MLTIAASLMERIKVHAADAYPGECSGLIVGEYATLVAREVFPVRNVHPEGTSHRYQIDPLEYLQIGRQARARGWSVIAVYHSHPDNAASPSRYDQACAWPGYVYIIVSVVNSRADHVLAWTLRDDGSEFDETPLTVLSSD